MGEEWIRQFSDLLTLTRHHIDRVVQKDAADLSRRPGHENLRAREASHCHWQCADVVLMRMRDEDGLDFAVGYCFEIGKRALPGVFRVHPAIEQESVSANFNVVRIRPDLRVACEISEFQMRLP